jgi:O-antigen ligase
VYNESLEKCYDNNRFKQTFITILILISVVQQMPIVRELYYTELRFVLYGLFGVFGIFSFKQILKYPKLKILNVFEFAIIYSVIITLLSFEENSISTLLEMLIPFSIMIISINVYFNKQQLKRLLFVYIMAVTILGISSLFFYGKGFEVTQLYLIPSKNQIGPMIGIALVISLIWNLNNNYFKSKYTTRIILLSFSTLLLLSLITIRNRSGLVALIIIGITYLFKNKRIKITMKKIIIFQLVLIIVFLLILSGAFNNMLETIWNSFTLNYNIRDLDSLSAGRFNVYKEAIEYIIEYPILGEFLNNNKFNYLTPHNYVLNKLVNFGFLVSLPILINYFYIGYYVIRKTYSKSTDVSLASYLLLFSITISIFEYTYPYGPGVTQLMVWFMIGQEIKKNSIKKREQLEKRRYIN